MNVDRVGTFKCQEVDRALSSTAKQGLPQLTIRVRMLEYYDTQEDAWVDFTPYNMEINAYFVLVFNGKDGKPVTSLSYKQLMDVYKWDGKDFQDLAEILPAPAVFQVRVEDNDPNFADKTPFKVNWIDVVDADPRSGLKKLDTAGIKKLQAQYGALLNRSGIQATPVTAKKAPPVVPVATPKVVAPVVETKPEVEAPKVDKRMKSERIKKANEKIRQEADARSLPPAPIPTDQQTEEVRDGCTKQEAWENIIVLGDANITDEQRTAAWRAAIQDVAGGIDDGEITPQQWHEIMHATLDDIGKF